MNSFFFEDIARIEIWEENNYPVIGEAWFDWRKTFQIFAVKLTKEERKQNIHFACVF